MSKEKKFKITAEQLMQLENGFTLPKLKEWFPEVFIDNPEIGKWYKSSSNDLYCVISVKNGIVKAYGFQNHKWLYGGTFGISYFYGDKEATEQEVFEALKNEAVKRGFVEGAYCNHENPARNQKEEIKGFTYLKEDNTLYGNKKDRGGARIFKNGVWATIIPTKTREQAEKELNCKIID